MNNDLYGVKEWPLTCIYTNSAAQSVTSGVTTRVSFNTVELDEINVTENLTAGVMTFTINRTGKLQILFTTQLGLTSSTFQGVYLYVNGTIRTQQESRAASSVSNDVAWMYQCTRGDVIYLETFLNGTSPTLGVSPIFNRLVFIYHAN